MKFTTILATMAAALVVPVAAENATHSAMMRIKAFINEGRINSPRCAELLERYNAGALPHVHPGDVIAACLQYGDWTMAGNLSDAETTMMTAKVEKTADAMGNQLVTTASEAANEVEKAKETKVREMKPLEGAMKTNQPQKMEDLRETVKKTMTVRKVVTRTQTTTVTKVGELEMEEGEEKKEAEVREELVSLPFTVLSHTTTNTTKPKSNGTSNAAAIERALANIETRTKHLAERASVVADLKLPSHVDFLFCGLTRSGPGCSNGLLLLPNGFVRWALNRALRALGKDKRIEQAFDDYKQLQVQKAKLLQHTAKMAKALATARPTTAQESKEWMEMYRAVDANIKTVTKILDAASRIAI